MRAPRSLPPGPPMRLPPSLCPALRRLLSDVLWTSNQHGARWRARACGNEVGRQRRGGHAALGRERFGRAAAHQAGAAAARSGLDRAAAARRQRGRPVQLPQAAPELWYAALPRLLRG